MDFLACVNFPLFSLQIVLREHPEWSPFPVVLLDSSSERAHVMQANKVARQLGITPSLSKQEAFVRAPMLRVATLCDTQRRDVQQEIYTLLFERFSPRIEFDPERVGLFWLEVKGLDALFGSFQEWGAQLDDALKKCGFVASIVIGSNRFQTAAIATGFRTGVHFFPTQEAERTTLSQIPLHRIVASVESHRTLAKLGIRTIGDLCSLPKSSINQRFGDSLYRLYHEVTEPDRLPLQRRTDEVVAFGKPLVRKEQFTLEHPVVDHTQLLFALKGVLYPRLNQLFDADPCCHFDSLLLELSSRYETPSLEEESDEHTSLMVKGHTPTRDMGRIIDSVRLRAERLHLPYEADVMSLTFTTIRVPPQQDSLFSAPSRRRVEQANEALDRIRNQFGDDVVLRWEETADQRPEKTFTLQPLLKLSAPTPHPKRRQLIRTILQEPLPLDRTWSEISPEWQLYGQEGGGITRIWGPYHWSGGWWRFEPEVRISYYAQVQRGDVAWLTYHPRLRRWFLQGFVG